MAGSTKIKEERFDGILLVDAFFYGDLVRASQILNQSNKNTKDKVGRTPLIVACMSTTLSIRYSVIEFVVSLGVDMCSTDECGNTVLHYLWIIYNEDILRLLFEHGAQTCLVVRNNKGKTPSQNCEHLRIYDEKYGRPFQLATKLSPSEF
jgi:ankyrin repeat protein